MPVRAGPGVRVVGEGEGDDTLTESCEGAVTFMVIEIRVGSLQELPVVVVLSVWTGLCGMRCAVKPKGGKGRFHDLGIFCFYQWEKEEGRAIS
jgi:hypothetical protein